MLITFNLVYLILNKRPTFSITLIACNSRLCLQRADRYWSTEPCRLGYKRDASTGYCVDIDECLVGPSCRDYEKCTNTPGSYDCSPLCSTGWFFNTATKSCRDVDECLLGRHDCTQGTHRCASLMSNVPCTRMFRFRIVDSDTNARKF